MTTPRSNDPNTRIRRGLNTLREMNEGRIPSAAVCRCANKESNKGPRDSSDKRLERNSNVLSDTALRTDNSLIARVPDGETRTRVATVSIATGSTSPAGTVETVMAGTVSTQLIWTFPATHLPCPCLNGLTINMDWDSPSSSWRGTAVGCLGDIYCILTDDSPSAGYLGISGTSYAVALANKESVAVTSGPFDINTNITSDQITVCGVTSGDAIPVDISER